MTRRSIFKIFSSLLTIPIIAQPCEEGSYGFPCLWNQWVASRDGKKDGTVSVNEIALWHKVCDRWKEVKKAVDKEYSL